MSALHPYLRWAGSLVLGLAGPGQGQVIIADDFDAATVSGWVSQGNTRTVTAHNITQTGSVLTSEVVASQTNTNRGIVSEASFDPAATGGFSMAFVVDGVSVAPGANGFFLGLVRENGVFHRDGATRNFGLAFFGQDPRTGSAGGFGLVYGDNNGSGPADFQFGNSDAQGDVELASFLDGFTATVTAHSDGWAYEITGLRSAAGVNTTFADAGTWAGAGTSFDSLWPVGQQ